MIERTPVRKSRYVSGIKKTARDGLEFTDLFAVKNKVLAVSSRDKPYLRLTLEDKSGTIEAFVWEDATEYHAQIQESDLVAVRCRSHIHKENAQLRVDRIWRLTEKDLDEIDRSEFQAGLDAAARDRIWTEVMSVLGNIENPFLTALIRAIAAEPGFREAFLERAAAKSIHHAYVGGLAEHTLGVLRLAVTVAELYRGRLNRDLLLAGAFLHDAAKIEEFDQRTGNYTDSGRLLGHLCLGVQMLERKAGEIAGFPPELLVHLQHMVISHHSRPDWGSPVKAQTLEAVALHFIDNLDAKVAGGWSWMESEQVPEGGWSSYWRGQDTQLLRTPRMDKPSTIGELEAELLSRENESVEEEENRGADQNPAGPSRRNLARRPPQGQERLL